MDIKEEEILGDAIDRHWYYRAKADVLLNLIQGCDVRSVVDVGAGSGYFSRQLLRKSAIREANCVDIGYEMEMSEQVCGKSIRYVRKLPRTNADLFLLMDVLEHVDDDVDLIRQCVQAADVGARFIISVPAFQFLWGPHDEFLEHRRRYTRRTLLDVVRKSGLEVDSVFYYYAGVFPIALIVRSFEVFASRLGRPAASSLRKHSVPVNWLLYSLSKLEVPLMRRNHLCGLTVFAVCRKP